MGQEFIHASEAYQKLSSTINHLSPEELYVSGIRLKELLLLHPVFDTSGKNQLKSEYNYTFNHQLQPSFNKNFDILSTNLADNEKAGFKTVIVANSPKQIDRIHRVFDDINAELDFTTLQLNIHSGFIDKDLKMVIYTDHQIFERYHRFRLKEGFTKTKQAITIKELTNLQKGDFVIVTIKDNGIGISQENLTSVFDPFFTTKDVESGTGLGLSISYGIIQEMKGEIKVESNLCATGQDYSIKGAEKIAAEKAYSTLHLEEYTY